MRYSDEFPRNGVTDLTCVQRSVNNRTSFSTPGSFGERERSRSGRDGSFFLARLPMMKERNIP